MKSYFIKYTEVKCACQLVLSFESWVQIDYRYDEEPLMEFQQQCARQVCDHMISSTADLTEIQYWKVVKKNIELVKRRKSNSGKWQYFI